MNMIYFSIYLCHIWFISSIFCSFLYKGLFLGRFIPKYFNFHCNGEWNYFLNLSFYFPIAQFSSVSQSCPTLGNPMNRSTPGLPVHHQLPEFTQTHVHRVSDAIQTSHPLSFSSPPAPNPCQHQGLFQRVNSSHKVAKVLEFQLQHQSFLWTPRTDLL